MVFDADVRTADQVLAAIRKLMDRKVRYLITSHASGDHATFAWHFREDRPIYNATRRQMRDMFMQESKEFDERKASSKPDDGGCAAAELVRPDIGFEGSLTLQFRGITFQLTEEGHGHSTSDVTRYVPQKRVFLAGDLLNNDIHPGKSEAGGVHCANVNAWIASLERALRDEVSRMIAAGRSLDQVRKDSAVPQPFAHYQLKSRLDVFLTLFCHQLLQRGF